MEKSHIIIVLLIIIIIILVMNLYNKKENITSDSGKTLSDEALQNIASVYNNKNLTVSNLTVTAWKGIICAWSGAITDIPQGWGFCDGTLYTALDGSKLQSPDLRSVFIIGASKPNTPTDGKTGGSNGQPSIPNVAWLTPKQVGIYGGEENHTLTVAEIPSHSHNHTHSIRGACGGDWTSQGAYGLTCGSTREDLNNSQYNYPIVSSDATPTGGGGAHNNMPPFYALAYIIKL